MLQINLWLFLIPPCHAPILMSKHHISWMPHMKVEACTFPLRTVPLKLPRGSTAKDRQNLELALAWLHISPWLRATWEARAEPEGKVLPLSSPSQLPPLSLLWYRDKGSPLFPAPPPSPELPLGKTATHRRQAAAKQMIRRTHLHLQGVLCTTAASPTPVPNPTAWHRRAAGGCLLLLLGE